MRVLVCGGRDYSDRARLFWFMDNLRSEFLLADDPIAVVIHGNCGRVNPQTLLVTHGADLLAKAWAIERNINQVPYPADWYPNGTLDKSAGPRRNQAMIDQGRPNLCVAFPGGRGTADMVRRAEAAGIPVRRVQ